MNVSRHMAAWLLTLALTIMLFATVTPVQIFAGPGGAVQESYGSGPGAPPGGPAARQSAAASGYTNSGAAAATVSFPAAAGQPVVWNDISPPEITGFSPADGAITGPRPVIHYSFTDESGVPGPDAVHLFIEGRCSKTMAGPTIITSSSLTYTPSASLPDGVHTIEAFLCDTVYNCNSRSWSIRVDATAPVISGAQPTGTINTPQARIAVSFSDGAGAGVDPARAALSIDGEDIAGCTITASGADCSVAGLADGPHSVQVEVLDLVGNRATKSWGFDVNAAALGITGQSPAAGSWEITGSPLIGVSFQEAGNGVIDPSSITLLLDGQDVGSAAVRERSGVSYRPAEPLSEGSHTVSVIVRDDAGHSGHSEWSFLVDTMPPRISDEAPIGRVASALPVASARYADSGSGINLASVSLSLDGVSETAAAAITTNSVNYTPHESLTPGIHSVQLTVEDVAGNRQTSAWNFNVPDAPRSVQMPAPGNPPAPAGMTLVEYWQGSATPLGVRAGSWVLTGFQVFPTNYYLPWYELHPGNNALDGEIIISNTGAGEAVANIFVGGENKWQGRIPEGGTETVQLPDATGGPVKIICPTGQSLEVMHRISGNGRPSETRAMPEEDLEPVMILPWYEARPGGQGSTSLVVGNAGAEEAAVDVYVGDPALPESLRGHYSIKPAAAARAEIPGAGGGPVRIVSTNNQPLVAGLQTNFRGSFSELQATGISRLGGGCLLPEYDMQPDVEIMENTVHIANSNGDDVKVEILIGDRLMHDPGNPANDYLEIPANSARAVRLNGAGGRPLKVVCNDCSFNQGISVSQQIVTSSSLIHATAAAAPPSRDG